MTYSILIFVLFIHQVFPIFFGGFGGNGCNCPQAISCPPQPVCPQPLPCIPLPPPIQMPCTPCTPTPVVDPCASNSISCSPTTYSGQWSVPAPQYSQPSYSYPSYPAYSTSYSSAPASSGNAIYSYGYNSPAPISANNLPHQIIDVSSVTLSPSLVSDGYAPSPPHTDSADKGKINVNPSSQLKELSEVDTVPFTDSAEENSIEEWPSIDKSGKITTEGRVPKFNDMFEKRYKILKKIKNVKTLAADIPRTRTTCNSNELAAIMVKAIVNDVSVAKRMVLKATELAFEGTKFDVFCATGEFSYSIHSRTYCEVTREDVTCFAFR